MKATARAAFGNSGTRLYVRCICYNCDNLIIQLVWLIASLLRDYRSVLFREILISLTDEQTVYLLAEFWLVSRKD